MSDAVSTLLPVGALALILTLHVLGDRRCREHFAAWAEANGYRLVYTQRRYFTFRFFLRSDMQRVYEIGVENEHGRRVGVAKVGGYFLGAFSNHIDVDWY